MANSPKLRTSVAPQARGSTCLEDLPLGRGSVTRELMSIESPLGSIRTSPREEATESARTSNPFIAGVEIVVTRGGQDENYIQKRSDQMF